MWLPPTEPSIEKGVGTAWLLTRLLPGISLAQDIANFSITGYQFRMPFTGCCDLLLCSGLRAEVSHAFGLALFLPYGVVLRAEAGQLFRVVP